MFSLNSGQNFYLYTKSTDMRKSFDALSGLVSSQMMKNPTSGEVFIFINKTKNKIKLLHWESYGFTLYYKRLEKGTIELPPITSGSQDLNISWSDLVLMIEGISLKDIKRKIRYNN